MYTEKIQNWYRALPDKKRYIELFTALLTVPVLITVIIGNVRNINSQQNKAEPSPSPVVAIIGNPSKPQTPTPLPDESNNQEPSTTPTETPHPSGSLQQCNPTVGNVEIKYPKEGETVTQNPVCIDIALDKEGYCSAVWSYRINAEQWSDYSDKSFCLYNLSSGEKKLEVRVKSIVSGDEVTRSRTFVVLGPSLTPTPESSQSASL